MIALAKDAESETKVSGQTELFLQLSTWAHKIALPTLFQTKNTWTLAILCNPLDSEPASI